MEDPQQTHNCRDDGAPSIVDPLLTKRLAVQICADGSGGTAAQLQLGAAAPASQPQSSPMENPYCSCKADVEPWRPSRGDEGQGAYSRDNPHRESLLQL